MSLLFISVATLLLASRIYFKEKMSKFLEKSRFFSDLSDNWKLKLTRHAIINCISAYFLIIACLVIAFFEHSKFVNYFLINTVISESLVLSFFILLGINFDKVYRSRNQDIFK